MTKTIAEHLNELDPSTPVLIAGPTASGKSALALHVAETSGGVVVNADAIQVYANWRVLTARPTVEDENRAPHVLYGHIEGDVAYSVGDWLRDLESVLTGEQRPIIVGGTGLYFTALTEGLAQIPETPAHIRKTAMSRIKDFGHESLLDEIDDITKARIDLANPMRVQRAWEVQQTTGRSIAEWQDTTPAPRLRVDQCLPIVIDAPKEWLTPRIEHRFAEMIETGALDEAKANRATWSKDLPSAKAIGAAELMAVIDGELSLEDACERASILTRQFAKRQRTWFRSRMQNWLQVDVKELLKL